MNQLVGCHKQWHAMHLRPSIVVVELFAALQLRIMRGCHPICCTCWPLQKAEHQSCLLHCVLSISSQIALCNEYCWLGGIRWFPVCVEHGYCDQPVSLAKASFKLAVCVRVACCSLDFCW